MSGRQTVVVGALVLLFSFLSTALGVYQYRQGALSLEMGSLYSSNAVSIDSTAAQATRELRRVHAPGRVFNDLAGGGGVRALATVGTPSGSLPIHSGRQPTERDERVALVGAAVHVTADDRYEFEGTRYDVIGRLGLRANSLLANDILLIDSRLFAERGEVPLVVDSPAASSLYGDALERGSARALETDAGRRTSIDYVSPLLLSFGAGMTLVGFCLSGWLAGACSRPWFALTHLVGTARWRVLAKGVARLVLVTGPIVLIGVILRSLVTANEVGTSAVVSLAAAHVGVAVVGYCTGVLTPSRGGHSWR